MASDEASARSEGDPGGDGSAAPPVLAKRVGRRTAVSRLALAGVALVLLGALFAGYRWQTDPERRLGPAPTVTGRECGLGQAPGAVVALDGDTGHVRWSRLVGRHDQWTYPSTGIAVADGSVAVVTGDTVQGLSAADGSHRWCGEGEIVSAVDDRLFTIHDDAVVEIDPRSGQVEPITPDVLPSLLEQAAGPIAVAEVGEPIGNRMTLTAAERGTGQELWTELVSAVGFVTTDDLLILHDQWSSSSPVPPGRIASAITARDLVTGDEVWSVPTEPYRELHLAGDLLVTGRLGSDDIWGRDAATGDLRWKVSPGNPGRTVRFSEKPSIEGVARDPRTGVVYVLLMSWEPHRD